MFRYFLLLLLFVYVEPVANAQDEVSDALAHSEALYYEARFQESIELLLRINNVLQPETGRLREKASAKLQLALAYIGLNESPEAKSFLRELYELDGAYRLDPQQFSPKVLALAEEAKAEVNEIRCQQIRQQAEHQIRLQDPGPLLNLIGSMKSICSGLEVFEADAAELVFKSGVELYKQGDLSKALVKFQMALDLSPKHDLAAEYSEIIRTKLQLSADRKFLDWEKHFTAGDFTAASADYVQLKSSPLFSEIRARYRKTLAGLVESWKQACAKSDVAGMELFQNQAHDMLPEPSIGEDLLQQMAICTNTSCLVMDGQLALTRLKTRVNPEISTAVVGRSPLTVRVEVRIDQNGDVSVRKTQGGPAAVQEAIRSAVTRWKFAPAIDSAGPRCVDTELPFFIKP